MNFLTEVIEGRRRDIEERKRRVSLDVLRASIAPNVSKHRDFVNALRSGSPAIVAEIKRASPSAGPLTRANPAQLARAYELAGAAAISVVTEPHWFHGGLQDLYVAREACSLPVLRKDFIIDEYQVVESAAAGADAVLLIVAVLDQSSLKELRALVEALDMCALVEVHTETEAARALEAGASVVGINNRDLNDFTVDLSTAPRVREALPAAITVVAESGYQSSDQLRECYEAGFDAVLVGEALLRAADPDAALRALRGVQVL